MKRTKILLNLVQIALNIAIIVLLLQAREE